MYIGLHVHSDKTVYVAQDEGGNVVGEGSVATTPQGFCRMVEKPRTVSRIYRWRIKRPQEQLTAV